MAKWADPSDDIIKEITEVLISTGLDNAVNTKIIANNDQKGKVITLKKAQPFIKFAFGYELILIINEDIYDELPILQKRLCIEEALSGAYHDGEKLVVGQPDLKTFHGFLDKHGYDQYKILEESIKTLYEAAKNNGEDPNVDSE
tara:strand:- start:5204 stop:5635 length:432 start_codon:yes stop_codon:yes gene_type:complete